MILDKIHNLALYEKLNPLFPVAFDYLRKTSFADVQPGRYEIQGSDVYALVQEYTTRPRSQGRWEAHRNYIDLQFMQRGNELMGVANLGDLKPLNDYDAVKDAEHLEGEGVFLVVPEAYFVIFGTEDAHMPCLEAGQANTVKKVVLKIRAT
ncbi:MAG TPA: YhcH/YjgK/YiaL family protein [Acidobacteriota bacterium]|nr:YhcH/YjgK/YiaL family protein [Acidobacteriota bacterium]